MRGVDGLTIDELRGSRDAWWDDVFTRALLDAAPATARTLVEIGCGLGRAAHELLPHRQATRYIGIDLDGQRLAVAAAELAAAGHGDRVRLLRAAGERVPIAAGGADIVLTCMTLQLVADVPLILQEARRVLAVEGVVVAVEPDHLGQRFYFDGSLDAINTAFAALYANRRTARLPADIAIGSRMASLLRGAGFRQVTTRIHSVQGGGHKTAEEVARELREVTAILRAMTDAPCEHEIDAFIAELDRWLAEVGPETVGQHAWFVPVFVTTGRR